jgi:hypothetical protein
LIFYLVLGLIESNTRFKPFIRNEIKYIAMVEMRRFRKSQKNRQRRGGALSSAPLNYSLAEGMAAKQSMAQGDQY